MMQRTRLLLLLIAFAAVARAPNRLRFRRRRSRQLGSANWGRNSPCPDESSTLCASGLECYCPHPGHTSVRRLEEETTPVEETSSWWSDVGRRLFGAPNGGGGGGGSWDSNGGPAGTPGGNSGCYCELTPPSPPAVPPPPPPPLPGLTQADPIRSCQVAVDMGAPSGHYWIQPDPPSGSVYSFYCDVVSGWTQVFGGNLTGPGSMYCPFITSSQSYTCDKDLADMTICDSCGWRDLYFTPPFAHTHLMFTGMVMSSGGYGGPVWGLPHPDRTTRNSPTQNCASNGVQMTETMTMNQNSANRITFPTWSDSGNVCGGSGAYWKLQYIWIK